MCPGECYSPGFKVDSNFECVRKVCQCNNGIGISDGSCIDETDNRCSECLVGFHLQHENCVANLVCADNQHLDILQGTRFQETSLICRDNECMCANGVSATDTCTRHMDHICVSCDDGFLKKEGRCIPNSLYDFALGYYLPENIKPLFEDLCIAPGVKLVIDDENDTQECIDKVCQCEHGTPISNGGCFDETLNKCDSCEEGFHLKIGEHGRIDCVAKLNCDEYQHLAFNDESEIVCEPNVCFCRHGEPVSSDQCARHVSYNCGECDNDYLIKIYFIYFEFIDGISSCVHRDNLIPRNSEELCSDDQFNDNGNCVPMPSVKVYVPETATSSRLTTNLVLNDREYCVGLLDLEHKVNSAIGLVPCDSDNTFNKIEFNREGERAQVIFLHEDWIARKRCLKILTSENAPHAAYFERTECIGADPINIVEDEDGANSGAFVFSSDSTYASAYLFFPPSNDE